MKNPILITPVKDSLITTKTVISLLRSGNHDIPYYIFDDFSSKETREWLEGNANEFSYQVIGLENYTSKISPNYRTTLILGQKLALEENTHLAIVESDVFASNDIILNLTKLTDEYSDAGLVCSITVDEKGEINFPYSYTITADMPSIFASSKRVSFCCTVISRQLLEKFDFNELPHNIDWFDVYISKKSRQLGLNNYVIKDLPVLHRPHSSRPWKHLKYKKPLIYYFDKFIHRRDRI